MAESVGAVHAEFTASTAQYRAELDAGKAAAAAFVEQNRKKLASLKDAGAESASFTAKFGQLGEQVKGAGGSVAAFTNALVLMGSTASPQVKALGSALGSLAATGFTPLGLAIGAVTAAVGYFVAQGAEASKALDEHRGRVESLREEIEKLRIASEAARTGQSPSAVAAQQELRRAEEHVRQLEALQQIAEERIAAWLQSQRQARQTAPGGIVPLDESRLRAAAHEQFLADAKRLKQLDVELSQAREIARTLQVRRDEQEELNRAEKVAAENAKAAAENVRRLADELRNPPPPLTEWFFGTESDKVFESAGDDAFAAFRRGWEKSREDDLLAGFRDSLAMIDADNERKLNLLGEPALTEQERATLDAKYEEARNQLEQNVLRNPPQLAGAMPQFDASLGDLRGDAAKRLGRTLDDPNASFGAGFSAQIDSIHAGLKSVGELGAETAKTLTDGFADAFADFATGTKSASEAFKEFAVSFIADVTRMLASQFALRAITTALGMPLLPIPAFAQGGSFRVGGAGGVDSELVMFRASPGERVDVTPPGGRRGRGGDVNVFVTVEDHAGAGVRTERRATAAGEELRVIVGEAVAADVARGGPASRALEERFGLRRRGRGG